MNGTDHVKLSKPLQYLLFVAGTLLVIAIVFAVIQQCGQDDKKTGGDDENRQAFLKQYCAPPCGPADAVEGCGCNPEVELQWTTICTIEHNAEVKECLRTGATLSTKKDEEATAALTDCLERVSKTNPVLAERLAREPSQDEWNDYNKRCHPEEHTTFDLGVYVHLEGDRGNILDPESVSLEIPGSIGMVQGKHDAESKTWKFDGLPLAQSSADATVHVTLADYELVTKSIKLAEGKAYVAMKKPSGPPQPKPHCYLDGLDTSAAPLAKGAKPVGYNCTASSNGELKNKHPTCGKFSVCLKSN